MVSALPPAVIFERVSYKYPRSEEYSLKKVNLRIEQGEFAVITGPSGCGKSTLCKCINGLIPHSYGGTFKGKVIVHGKCTLEHPVYELAQLVGLVFQDPESQLFCSTVEKEIAFGLENLGLPREEILARVEEALDLLGIAHLRYRAPYELSGGEQQKVAIASCIAMRPKVLVLDEPTANLDPLSAKSVLDVVYALNKKLGVTVILVEHRLEMISHLASKLVVMYRGEVLTQGPPREVLFNWKILEIGVGLPKPLLIALMLAEKGFPIEAPPLLPEELVELVAGGEER